MTNKPGDPKTSREEGGERIEPGLGEQLTLFSGGPGAWLRKVREEKKISQETVAAELNIGPGAVRALERDDYEPLPEAVYVRGYIRNYARLLGEPVEPLLDAFQTLNPPPEEEPALQSLPIQPEISSSHHLVRLASVIIVLVLVGLVFIWWGDYLQRAWWKKDGQVTVPAGEEMELPAPELYTSESMPLDDPSLSMSGDEQFLEVPLPVAPSEPATPDTVPMDEAGAEAPADQEADLPPEIVFRFSATSWVKVQDAAGTVQLIGEFNAGARQELKGEPPFQVVLGNTPAVELMVNGQPVDLMQHSRGNVARFVLDPREP